MSKEYTNALAEKQSKFLDFILDTFNIKNDAALSLILEINPTQISLLRRGKLKVGSAILIYLHEAFNIEIKKLKELLV